MDCFPSIEDLANTLQKNNNSACQPISREIVEGNTSYGGNLPHFKFNYQYYAEKAWSNRSKPVAVLRTEYLWNDVARVETVLGGNASLFLLPEKQIKYTHGSEKFQKKSRLSREGNLVMCCALREELQVYQDLIVNAVNLHAQEKKDSIQSVLNDCGVDKALSLDEVLSWQWRKWYDERCAGLLWWT